MFQSLLTFVARRMDETLTCGERRTRAGLLLSKLSLMRFYK